MLLATTNSVIECGSRQTELQDNFYDLEPMARNWERSSLIAFLWFALRQGKRLKPGHEHPPSPYT